MHPVWSITGFSWRDRLTILVVILAASVFPVDLQPETGHGARGSAGQLNGKQGVVLPVRVVLQDKPQVVRGKFLGRHIPFFQTAGREAETAYVGLVGIDMLDSPGTHELVVKATYVDKVTRRSYHVLVVPEKFPVQRLTLPNNKVDLDQKSLTRVKAEQRQVREILAVVSDGPAWSQQFVEPVKGKVAGAFGRKRVINGQPRNPHSGEDISAPLGTEVVATNDGIIRLTVDHFFSGKGVFIDHGLGLLSMYFHLSAVVVKEGQFVTRGQVVGRVGATGRATGPHLHWGIRLNGARVNPYSLLKLHVNSTAPVVELRKTSGGNGVPSPVHF